MSPTQDPSKPRSDALVFFGATGDLAYKQIFPALHAMARRGHLDVPVIGVAKSGWTLDALREHARKSVAAHGDLDEAAFAQLARSLQYIDGDYRSPETYAELRRALSGRSRPAHYLAIPPDMFPTVVEGLRASGAADGARVIVEKPFGRNLASARKLNQSLRAVFDEASIFRIDHYLGKEPVQNLAVFRFANAFMDPIWNNRYVSSVQITMAESFGVAGRGGFYDGIGAIRDVVQNHLLEVVSLLAMEAPVVDHGVASPESLRDEQVKVFRAIRAASPKDVVRGQFRGYRAEPGVAQGSTRETFAALRLHVDSWRWEGVPFLLRAGKRLPTTLTEVVVRLKRAPLSPVPRAEPNYLRFRLSPEVIIALGARVKRPGEILESAASELRLVHQPEGDELEAYERLLGDAMSGDQTLFARQDGVEAAWRVVDPILDDATPIHEYEPGTWGPEEASALAASCGGFTAPEPAST